MNWKTIVALIIASPFVALLGGVGVLAYNISQTWDARNTDALISGLVASCGIGGIVIAGLLTAIIGIPMAMRLMDKWRESELVSPNRGGVLPFHLPADPYRRHQLGYREPQPPMLTTKSEAGSWRSNGPYDYDLWEEEPDPRHSG